MDGNLHTSHYAPEGWHHKAERDIKLSRAFRIQTNKRERNYEDAIELNLLISSDAEDTDFIAKLCVQEPSGAITCLALGSLRCRYRNSWTNPKPLTPGNITPIHLQMGHTAYVFPAGSRICLIITSSDFPRIQPHSNTMASPFSETRSIPALNSILHGNATPSCLKLPIISIQ